MIIFYAHSQGNKEKNIEDMHDLMLVFPSLEYHNEIWTWWDFVMAIKADCKRDLVSQVCVFKLSLGIFWGLYLYHGRL